MMGIKEALEGVVWSSQGMDEHHESRDAYIRLARDYGAPVRAIANAAGLSKEGVRKILNKSIDASPVRKVRS